MSLSGCQGSSRGASFSEEKTLSDTTLTQADKGKSVTIRSGEVMGISLDENPGTGFRWTLEQGNGEILELLSSDYIQAPGSEVGGGGKRIWKFKAKKVGDVQLVLKRWRPWEGDNSTVERFEIIVHVKN
jgi:inhibitor of cysteine peptidase